jgi:cytochrome b subunit of formate dehydrogenase
MKTQRFSMTALAVLCFSVSLFWQTDATAETLAKLDNPTCLSCHDATKLEAPGSDGKARPLLAIKTDKYGQSVHAKMECVACHTEIKDSVAKHKIDASVAKPDCATCHEALWKTAKEQDYAKEKARLGVVVDNINSYKDSFHARPNKEDETRVNAKCDGCHDTHSFNVPPAGTAQRANWRLGIPKLCGESCHSDELEEYLGSVHGKESQEKHNLKAALCSDCHTTHKIGNTSSVPVKLVITANCGGCHENELETYRKTYHGQVGALGYSYTAKCFDCHGSHGILKVDDPQSKVAPKNRLKTCKQCHNGKKLPEATAGYTSFGPHASADNYEKYPQMWIASRFMVALLMGVFAFFWLHCGLWYYREWKDRKEGKRRVHIRTADLNIDHTKQVKRFALGWRIAHLCFALVTMTLVLTGTTALFASSGWAPVVAKLLGGPSMVGIIHRVAAFLFIGIFFIHFLYVMYLLLVVKRGKFRWFGPDSLVPRWQDLIDVYGMFKWFLGKGPRPALDRWAYFEKFDYWAVFWGVNVIGFSGMMLAFPHVTAQYLPGWIFNVATLVHGEEAFLAAVFLFTVHFFNNHFRPDKLPPPDIVMFTGSQSIEEFRHDHPAQYDRLVKSGELEKYLVDAPSVPMERGSKILGLVLITFGLTLLVLVAIGFFGGTAVG